MMRVLFLFIAICSFHTQVLMGDNYLGVLQPDSNPIDVVYTWVDGNDPDWQKQRATAILQSTDHLPQQASSQNRFRDRNELRYSLRSINQFARFVHHIYIVTCGQKPKWLKDHPKITIIHHQDIFRDKSCLPTFNSQAIEANLHNIPNLSERFIYFNDDFLLGNNVEVDNFFDASGKIKVLFSGWTTPKGSVTPEDDGFRCAWKVTNRFLDSLFKPKSRKAVKHAPYALRKSHLQRMQEKYSPLFKKVSQHKFRSSRDYVLINGLIQYIALNEEHACLASLTNSTVGFTGDLEKNQQALHNVLLQRPHTICIQDLTEESNEALDLQLKGFFEEYYKEPAPWEILAQ